MVSSTPMTVHASGMQVATGLPAQLHGSTSNVPGGLLNAAAAKTAASIAEQASQARAGGVTMKGGGEISVPPAPEGKSIPGVSFAGNHANLTNIANQLKAGAVYDGLAGTQPYKLGGRRRHPKIPRTFRRRLPTEEPVVAAGRKHKRKTKKNVRRRRHRTIRRKHSKSVHHSRRRSSRNVTR